MKPDHALSKVNYSLDKLTYERQRLSYALQNLGYLEPDDILRVKLLFDLLTDTVLGLIGMEIKDKTENDKNERDNGIRD
jgi:hypothetical protein|tara:strand:+ start:2109 stop:2345 length:237 start_codon:yes stop_codon:yes gene_type:complete